MKFIDTIEPRPLTDKDIWVYNNIPLCRVRKVAEALTKLKRYLWKYNININKFIEESFPAIDTSVAN
jgi:hypothetical protein